MAITPVKTGNVTMTPPAKTTDAKLNTQFNAAVKAGEKGPSTSTPPPFYTPAKGHFRGSVTYFFKKYTTHVNWTVNPNQQAGTNKVFIGGALTVDWPNGKISYPLDGNASYIDNNGDVYYTVAGDSTYKTNYNLFDTIEKNVNTALKKVISNKEYLKSAKGDISPASVASASLTRALLQVGEFNLIRGKGLNGAGARIAGKLEAQLAKKDTDENKVRIRQAIALAMTLAGNQKEMPKITQQSDKGRMLQPVPPRRLTPTEIIRLRIQDDVMRRLNVARRELYPNNRTLTPSQIQGIITRVYAAYRDNDAVLREHAAAYAREFAEPGVLRENGINYEWQTLLILPIVAYFAGDGTDLGTILTNLGVPDANQRAVQNLLRWNNPLDRSNIELLGIRAFAEVMNPNAEIMAGLERLAAGDPAAEQNLLVLRQQLFWYNWPQNYRY